MASRENPDGKRLRLSITVGTVTRILVALSILLVIISYSGQLAWRAFDWHPERDIISFFNVDRERNLPTSFQTLLFLSCALALAGITVMKRLTGDRWALHWGLLSLFFVVMGWDEIAEVHERFIEPMRRIFDLEGIFFFGWIIPAGIAVTLFGLAYVRFLLALPQRTRTFFIVGGLVAITGAIGLEAIGGWYYERIDQNADMLYVTIATIEESMEKAGLIIFLHAALTYLSTLLVSARIELSGEPGRLWIDAVEQQSEPDTQRREAGVTSRRR